MHRVEEIAPWSSAWAWAIPLIVLTVMVHTGGLIVIHATTVPGSRNGRIKAVLLLGMTVLAITGLHAAEAALWAACYLVLGALPDVRTAMLYSMEAMTTYGHSATMLLPHWQMMGALEALNGMILFGLTTAFLFTRIYALALQRRE